MQIKSCTRLVSIATIMAVTLLVLVGVLLSPRAPESAQAQEPECPWMDTSKTPDERAQLLLDASTLDQKIRWLTEWTANNPTQTVFTWRVGSVWYTATYPAQVPCTPFIQYVDGPTALSGPSGVTVFPSQMALAATWDVALSRLKGQAQGYEAFLKRRNVLLGPGLASEREPRSGRTPEYLGEDPLLAGVMAAAMIQGVQEDNPDTPVEAVIKHYVANEQEIDRNRSSSNMDERTLREIYVLPFEIAVKDGHPYGVMCAYNQVNGVYSCENAPILRDILKDDVGFEGWVVSDFGAVHSITSTPPSLIAGLDQELNRPRYWTSDTLHTALNTGLISEEDIDEAAFRIVRSHIAAGLFDHPLPAIEQPNVSTPEHQAIARQVAEEGAVLLKNQGGILPLGSEPITIAVIGPTAALTTTGGVNATTVCAHTRPRVNCAAIVAPLDGITARATQDGSTVVFDSGSNITTAVETAMNADVAIVFGYYTSGEFNDLADLSLDGNGDALISAVAAANSNTIVILQTGGPVLMPWINQVKAVLEVWYAGQEMGNAIAALLWGDVNPSGKLPMTFPKSEADRPTAESSRRYPGVFADGTITRTNPNEIRQVYYEEGLLVGYRWYDSQGIEPLFPFGHGLSYTSFDYSNLSIRPRANGFDVNFTVRNSGSMTGTEIPQVYLGFPAWVGEPPKRLVGWARVTLSPGEQEEITVTIDANSSAHPLSYWDANLHRWVTPYGSTCTVYVGASSRDIRLINAVRLYRPVFLPLVMRSENQ